MRKTANEPCVTRSRFGLPVLARELTELAGRRRTYALRTLYAALLFLLAYYRFTDILGSRSGDGFALLGQGRRMFETLVLLEFAGIYLFMPALASSAITHEKERNSLGLLFLTRLGPTTILLEKLLSRLVPMFVFLLLAMPLLAFTYTLGGVDDVQFYGSILVLTLTAVQVASISLMCSAYCMTTIAAFVASYALSLGSLIFCSCCGLVFSPNDGAVSVGSVPEFVTRAFLLGTSTVVFLGLARSYLVSRAFVVPNSLLFRSLRRLDRFYVRVDESTGGIVIVRHVQSLPADDPVRWREVTKSSLGSSGYLARIVLSIEVPLFLLLMLGVGLTRGLGHNTLFIFVEVFLWIVAALVLVVTTTGLICRERSRQTLDALLTTPLSGREILLQKLSTVRRLVMVLWIPFGTLVLFLFWLWADGGFAERDGLHLTTTLLSALVYLPLIVWVSFWISLRVKSQGRAILLSIALLFAWAAAPVYLVPYDLPRLPTWLQMASLLTSPSAIVLLNEAGHATLSAVSVNFLIYGGLLAFIRFVLLYEADVYLGRLGPNVAFSTRSPLELAARPTAN